MKNKEDTLDNYFSDENTDGEERIRLKELDFRNSDTQYSTHCFHMDLLIASRDGTPKLTLQMRE